MKVFVTGASGGLGRRMTARLRRAGHELTVLRHRRPIPAEGVRVVDGSLEDAHALRAGIDGVDCVLHLAAVTHSRRTAPYTRVNVEGTRRLLEAGAGTTPTPRFVFVSSTAAEAAGGAYSASKAAAEREVRAYRGEHVILRPAEVYGTGGHEGIERLVSRVRENRAWIPIPGDGRERVGPVAIEDVEAGIERALSVPAAANRTFALAGPETMTLTRLVERLRAHFSTRTRVVPVPLVLARPLFALISRLPAAATVPDQLARLLVAKDYDIRAAREVLAYSPRRLEDGLASATY